MSLSPAEQQQILVWSQEGIGLAEQARRLGRPVTNLQATYRRYVRAGLIPKRERPPWRPWTSGERDQLHALIDGGYSYDAIARKLKRSRNAIVVETKRRYHRVTTTPATWSAHDVARLLGLGCSKTVSRWIGRSGASARPISGVSWRTIRRGWLGTWNVSPMKRCASGHGGCAKASRAG